MDRAVAEHLLHVQRDEEEHREQRRADAADPTTFAPVSVRMRKILNGTSGAFERSSIATKLRSGAADSASSPTV